MPLNNARNFTGLYFCLSLLLMGCIEYGCSINMATENPQMPVLVSDYKSVKKVKLTTYDLKSTYQTIAIYRNEIAATDAKGILYIINLKTNQKQIIPHQKFIGSVAALSDRYIVWITDLNSKNVDASAEIVVYDRLISKQRTITQKAVRPHFLSLDGNRIVWTDKRNELNEYYDSDIYVYDLLTNIEYPIAITPGEQTSPSIQGDYMVWADNRNYPAISNPMKGCENCVDNPFDIYLYDFKTKTARPIVADRAHNGSPTISGQDIVWVKYGFSGSADLYALNLKSNTIRRLTQTMSSEGNPYLFGNQLFWTIRSACDVLPHDPANGIYMSDLSLTKVQQLDDKVEPIVHFSPQSILVNYGCMTFDGFYILAIP